MIRRMMGAVGAVLALLGGLWLVLAPFAVGFQAGGDWSRATTVTVVSGGAVAVLAFVAFVASVAGLVGDVRRRAGAVPVAVSAAVPGAGVAVGTVAAQGFPQARSYPQAGVDVGDEAGSDGRMGPGSPPLGGWGYGGARASDPARHGGVPATVDVGGPSDDGPAPGVRTIELPDLLRVVLPALTRDLDARWRIGEPHGEFPRRPTVGVNGRIGPAWSGFLHDRSRDHSTPAGSPAATMADAVLGRRSADGGESR